MKTWLRVFVVASSFCVATGTAFAQPAASPSDGWNMVSEESGYTLWAGKPKPAEAQVAIDILFQYDEKRPHLDYWFYRSVKQNFQFDCKASTYRVMSLEMFTDEWATSEVLHRRRFNNAPLDIAEGSRAAVYSKLACGLEAK